jgi:hypothetical protein
VKIEKKPIGMEVGRGESVTPIEIFQRIRVMDFVDGRQFSWTTVRITSQAAKTMARIVVSRTSTDTALK